MGIIRGLIHRGHSDWFDLPFVIAIELFRFVAM